MKKVCTCGEILLALCSDFRILPSTMKLNRLPTFLFFAAFCFVMVHHAAAQRPRPGGSSSTITPPPPVVINPVSKG
jgi:hypothetical protein